MTRIVFSGVFDRFPNLKVVTHHLGGMIPYFAERIRGGYENFGTRTDEDAGAILAGMKKPVHEYFKMFYADTVVFGSVLALECAFKFFGPERIVFASDMPFDPDQGYRKIHRTITGIEEMNAALEDKSKIFELNARRLLRRKDQRP
jgi:aminocarboxymuconate-semialdehyde decarboxylase